MIERFDRSMIERFLRSNDLRFLVDQDGDFVVNFYGAEGVPDHRVQLSAEGEDRDVLCIRVVAEPIVAESMRDRIEGLVAGWNRRARWPKAFIADDVRGRGILVVGETSFPVGPGVHQALVDNFIAVSTAGGWHLLAELARAVEAPGVAEIEQWMRRTG